MPCWQGVVSYMRQNGEGTIVLDKQQVDSQLYRDAMSRFGGAVHVVTTDGPSGRRGVTIIAGCSVSDHPPTILVCLSRVKPDNDVFAENGVFALNTLAAEHKPLADAFSGLTKLSQEERFALGTWETVSTGAPVLTGALTSLDCRIVETKDVATHRILFGEVTGIRIGDRLQPLIYQDRRYHILEA
jgi:cob(II)yrinic acid a,c-diamide reductase